MKNRLITLSMLAWLTTICFSVELQQEESFFNASTVTHVEYFINNDPGYGNGTQLPFTQNGDNVIIETEIELDSELEGFNQLFLRVQNSSGAWSMVSKRFFFIEQSGVPGIKSFEYYFTNSSDFLSPQYEVTAEKEQVNMFAFDADVSELKFDSIYTLHVWAIDSLNRRSYEASAVFTYSENNTGLEFSEVNKGFIHPNPANDYITFKLDENLIKNTNTIRIINMDGKVVLQITPFSESFNKLNIQSLPTGTYMLQLIGKEIYSATFIKN